MKEARDAEKKKSLIAINAEYRDKDVSSIIAAAGGAKGMNKLPRMPTNQNEVAAIEKFLGESAEPQKTGDKYDVGPVKADLERMMEAQPDEEFDEEMIKKIERE